ncbi:MAG: hypothetical protein A2Z03_03460 [Chloroflexi bacterium RBG_16_56_8]|nr:MAG: hypothetical protein A2Z03_03460 [Chloroflexi bacterium RBG_16_56_8]
MRKVKSQAKKTRETRVAYRAKRKSQAGVPRTPKPRVRKQVAAAKSVPWEKRIAPTEEQIREWTDWLNQHEPEFEIKYPGHYLAIWDRRIIGASPSHGEVYRLAGHARPDVIPLITYVPRPNEIFAVPSNFPAEWLKKTE